jgi:hypothetical protein
MAHENAGVQSVKGALEPKIEPEIVFCLRSAPKPGMSDHRRHESSGHWRCRLHRLASQ